MLTKKLKTYASVILNSIQSTITWDPWHSRCWSQEGEDQILSRIFGGRTVGYYVDVGAHHPKRFSNTYLFYKRGWRGINIDASPGSMRAFQKTRPRDTNLEIGVGERAERIKYHVFNEPALNSFSPQLSRERDTQDSPYKIQQIVEIDVFPLHKILDEYLPENQAIDFMTVDAEGLDYEVLKSNNWDKYRPSYVLAEVLASSLHDIHKTDAGILMADSGYQIYAKCMNTVFFKNVFANQQ